jgi:adenylosuccinate lyase
MSAGVILAEPIYIALQMAGYQGDAHELVNRKAMPLSQKKNQPLITSIWDLTGEDGNLISALARIPPEVMVLFEKPENYTGDAAKQAIAIADMAEQYARAV